MHTSMLQQSPDSGAVSYWGLAGRRCAWGSAGKLVGLRPISFSEQRRPGQAAQCLDCQVLIGRSEGKGPKGKGLVVVSCLWP